MKTGRVDVGLTAALCVFVYVRPLASPLMKMGSTIKPQRTTIDAESASLVDNAPFLRSLGPSNAAGGHSP